MRPAAAPAPSRALQTAIGAAACASEIMPRIGTVERLVAEREVRNDIVLDRGFEQRPLEPGGVAGMAARDAAIENTHPDQHVAAERLGHRDAFARAFELRQVDAGLAVRN